jgi:hypothetical protein
MKEYPCALSSTRLCKYGGNKRYNYGFLSGTAGYCRKIKCWVVNIKVCPIITGVNKNE